MARQAGGQPLPLDNLKANDLFFFFPSFAFCPLYCNMNFVKAAICCHAKHRVVARRDPDWLIGSTRAK